MNVCKTLITVSLLLLAFSGAAQAESVSWIPGEMPPRDWSITPANPTPTDVIEFSGPTTVFSNSCIAERNLGGVPRLMIDSKAKVILLWFEGPVSQVCPMIYNPVAGLAGDFGPLDAGEWLFRSLSKEAGFEIAFTVRDATVYHVDADAPGPVHDGLSWATAFLTLQDALAVAGSADEIVVAEGRYKPDQGDAVTPGDREASFVLLEGLVVRGGFAGYGQPNPDARDVGLYETVLTGDLNGNDLWGLLNLSDNSYHVVTGPAGEPPALLDGFTITSGNADGPYPHHYGGGLYIPGGRLDVVHSTILGNTAVWGGGAMTQGGAVRMVNTQIIGNRALLSGGGLYNLEGDVTLHNARIVGNSADYAGTTGGTAIYNLDGTLTVLNSTIADNRSPDGKAIVSFSWGPSGGVEVVIANSILYNGGTEISTNRLAAVEVTYSDVQDGWAGTGNIDTNPQFVSPGVWSVEGQWIDGDYRLNASSPAIDVGSDAALPADAFDLDADSDVAEPIPFDLDDEARVEGIAVDMGPYEQAKKVAPLPGVTLIACLQESCFALEPDPSAPLASNTFLGSVDLEIDLNFQARVRATVTAESPAGGKWTGWLEPDVIGPGTSVTTLWVRGEGLDLLALPAGSKNVQVAGVTLSIQPIF